jgi:hypothetical protein
MSNQIVFVAGVLGPSLPHVAKKVAALGEVPDRQYHIGSRAKCRLNKNPSRRRGFHLVETRGVYLPLQTNGLEAIFFQIRL